ncbi:hypothetical protein DSO57_1006997 [Entomophthora muscae]|uniref:Uncharacterized protein n=1 Tax=Entomophthora muscae TaxID=34485 RepID=A0ACC2UT37_9FUNG|nr:hypothetical protein DSO57_1006997 [Entomophthora muscae]
MSLVSLVFSLVIATVGFFWAIVNVTQEVVTKEKPFSTTINASTVGRFSVNTSLILGSSQGWTNNASGFTAHRLNPKWYGKFLPKQLQINLNKQLKTNQIPIEPEFYRLNGSKEIHPNMFCPLC